MPFSFSKSAWSEVGARRRIFSSVILFGLLAILQSGLAMRYWPHVGHDYLYFAPRFFDVQLHYEFEGWGIQWWTPSFGGGLPAFANPQHTQFSFSQLLVPRFGPYFAAVLSAVLLNAMGGLFVAKFLVAEMGAQWRVALLSGLAFAANGFSVMALLVGHVTKFYFPLVALLPFVMMKRIPRLKAVGGFALLVAGTVYAGGYAVIVVVGLTALILCPLLSVLSPDKFEIKETGIRIFLGVILGGICCLFKLAAVSAWMTQSPRPGTIFPASALSDLVAMPLRLAPWEGLWVVCLADVTKFGLILGKVFGENAAWEHCVSVHLPIWIMLGRVIGRVEWFPSRLRWPLLLLLLALLIVLQICLARGVVWTVLSGLPLFSALHANHRFIACLVLPLVLLAGASQCSPLVSRYAAFGISLGIGWVLVSQIMLLVPVRTYPFHSANLAPLEAAWQQYRNDPASMRFVRKVGDAMDTEVFLRGESSLSVYEPIFGYGIPPERFRTTLESGQAVGLSGLNIHHPQAFVAPGLVGVQPYSKIPAADGARAGAFLARRQPDWPQPLIIKSFYAVSALALAVAFIMVVSPSRYMGRLQ